MNSHQIDDRENADPDDVECMPEEIETDQSMDDLPAKSFYENLGHHRGQPDAAERDVQAMQSDQPIEGSKHCAALRREAAIGELDEFPQFKKNEYQSQQACQKQKDERPQPVACIRRRK